MTTISKMYKLNIKIIRIKKLVELGGIEPPTSSRASAGALPAEL